MKKPGSEPNIEKEEVAEVSFGKTRKQIKALVEQTAREKQVLRKEKLVMLVLDVSWSAILTFFLH